MAVFLGATRFRLARYISAPDETVRNLLIASGVVHQLLVEAQERACLERGPTRTHRISLASMQLTVWGIPVTNADARSLVATLIADGHPDGIAAAASIDRALDDGGGLVGLTPAQRDTVLGALEDPPEGLSELRGALARDFEHRHRA